MIYYLVLAHKSPEQLEILSKTLFSKNSRIYIHIDGYSDFNVFYNSKYLSENCIFIKNNVKIRWGGFSMVQGILNTIQKMKDDGLGNNDHIVIMSGQDFPLISSDILHQNLSLYCEKSIMEYRIQPNDNRNILNRVMKYHFHDVVVPQWLNNFFEYIISFFIALPNIRNQIFIYILQRIVNFALPIKKYLVKNYHIYWGSSWMILGGNHANYILQFCETNKGKKFINAFKTVAGPDELFFQTLLLNSHYKDQIVNDLPRYIDWKKGPGLPRILDKSDLENIIAMPNKWFARKFEYPESYDLIKSL